MCKYEKLSLSIDTTNDVIGRVVSNKESQWEKYSGMPSDFITEVFHAPTEEALLYVFRSYIDNEDYWAARWADDTLPRPAIDLNAAYTKCHLIIVYEDSGHPLIQAERFCLPNKERVETELNEMIDSISAARKYEM